MLNYSDIAQMDACRMGALMRENRLCPVDLMEYTLEAIARYPDQNVFLSFTAERARREAQAARKRLRAGAPASPLDGVPIAWKDNVDIEGAVTTVGSSLFADSSPATRDQVAAARLAAAGMVCIGKLNMTEFAYSGLGFNPHFGTPRNPNSPDIPRAPGGSSSGSGVAVAAGLVPCTIGTDTGGSIRIPAAFNGVVGYKASEGRTETEGIFPLSPTLDTLGPLARTVCDCSLLSQIMRGQAPNPVGAVDQRALRIVVPTNEVLDRLEPDVETNFWHSIATLEEAGIPVQRQRIEALSQVVEMTERHGTLTAAEAYSTLHCIIDGTSVDRVDPRVVRRVLAGKRMSAFDLLEIQRTRKRLVSEMEQQFGDALIAMPTAPVVAPEIAPLEADQEAFMRVNARILKNTVLGNVLNFCGVALPNGRNADGMPTSLLISAPGGHDDRLIAACFWLERVLRD